LKHVFIIIYYMSILFGACNVCSWKSFFK